MAKEQLEDLYAILALEHYKHWAKTGGVVDLRGGDLLWKLMLSRQSVDEKVQSNANVW